MSNSGPTDTPTVEECLRKLGYDFKWVAYGFLSIDDARRQYAQWHSGEERAQSTEHLRFDTARCVVQARTHWQDQELSRFIECLAIDSDQAMAFSVLVDLLSAPALQANQVALVEEGCRKVGVKEHTILRRRALRRIADERPLTAGEITRMLRLGTSMVDLAILERAANERDVELLTRLSNEGASKAVRNRAAQEANVARKRRGNEGAMKDDQSPKPIPVLRSILGAQFERLHPKLQAQYSIDSSSGLCFHGKDMCERLWRAPWFMPCLWIGSRRLIMFPEAGRDLEWEIRNYAYRDKFGRETLTWSRVWKFPGKERRFDEAMVNHADRGPIMYAGTHQHLAVDMNVGVGSDGALEFSSGAQRLFMGGARVRFPMLLSGMATGRARYDEAEERFKIIVEVRNRTFGTIFAYQGWFIGQHEACAEVPADARPVREEERW